MEFAGAHILSVEQFERSDIERIFDVADTMAPYALREKVTRVLEGAILGNMFFEPSTRTRLSFEAAIMRLGARNISTENAKEASSATKGESLEDTIRRIIKYKS